MIKCKSESTALHKLKAWMSKDRLRSKSYLSRELGVSHTSVCLWLDNKSRPEHLLRILIQIVTNDEVLINDWLTLDEKENIEEKVKTAELKKVG